MVHKSSFVLFLLAIVLSVIRFTLLYVYTNKKSVKMPKGQSEDVKRMTDNTMAKRKRTNEDL
jgi:phosphotransferase system  glucose/maltose/N-acetylglucosamine-specific IIC component